MKKFTWLILGVITSIYACKRDPIMCCVVAQRTAEITAQKNGVLWSPFFVSGALSNVDSLAITAVSATFNTTYTKLDTLNIKLLYANNGTYKLVGNQVYYATFANGTTNSYQIDPTFNNELNITGYQILHNPATTNPDEVKVTGTFNIKFIDPANPAGISFLNGNFFTIMSR
ncbi:MAG: hypothetical protein JWP37_3376 [Mucilaginibacter sp.]|nr:hypothetical protein [Mucilaginibacter sp.]